MSTPNFNFNRTISRRTLLRGAGVSMALPWLTAMQTALAANKAPQAPRRFVSLSLGLGLHAENLNPAETGKDYKPSRYLEAINDLREHYTIVSGSSHPGVAGGHTAEASILTANPSRGAGASKNTISLDQYMAKYLGGETRYRSLVLGSSGTNSPSYTENGAMIPAQSSPSQLFAQLFINDSPAELAQQALRVQEGRSIMDLVGEDARRLQKKVGRGDKERLDAYFTSVRDLEVRMSESEAWAKRPKPKVDYQRPRDIADNSDFIGRQRLMCDMIRLALETDSTRFISYHLGGGGGVVPLEGVEESYHGLSHHGMDPEKLEQLAIVETAIVSAWGDFLRGLNQTNDQGANLLDQTSVLLTSNLGNASNHSNKNMPVLLAGGGFKHGQHLGFDTRNNYPLTNMFVSLLQRQGMEVDSFATGTSTMTGLEFA